MAAKKKGEPAAIEPAPAMKVPKSRKKAKALPCDAAAEQGDPHTEQRPPGSLDAFVAEVRSILRAADCHEFSDRLPDRRDRQEPCISVSWTTGGVTGGSCWNDEPTRHRGVSSEPPQELTGLDIILEALYPDVSFMAYRKLVREVVETKTYRGGSDFYGNYTDEAAKMVRLSVLYEAFRERGWPTP